MKTIKEAKARMTVGARLLCVANTYRPVLNGTERTITKSPGTTWKWRGADGGKESHSVWPSGITVVDADTIRIPLGRTAADGQEHYVELRFIQDAPAQPVELKATKPAKPTAFTFATSAEAYRKAEHMNRYAHKHWAVWRQGVEWHAAEVTAAALERAIEAVGEEGRFTIVQGPGHFWTVRPPLARVFIANLNAGHYAHC